MSVACGADTNTAKNNREADPDLDLGAGPRPLHVAVHFGCRSIVKQLLTAGSDVNATHTSPSGQAGLTALHLAVLDRHVHLVRLLADHAHCNVTLRSRDRQTAYDMAVAGNMTKVYSCLRPR